MPNGRVHFKSNVISGILLVGGGLILRLEPEYIAAIGLGSIAGTLITPDYDLDKNMPKNVLTKLNPWKWMWYPYRKIAKHRGFISHSPILSTAIRVLYLVLWFAVGCLAAMFLGFDVWPLLNINQTQLIFWCFMLGAWMFQDLVHIFLDYF